MTYSLWVRRYAPFENFGLGFEGDNRKKPSTNMSDTARTIAGCSFGPDGAGPGVGESSGTDHFLWPGDKVVAKVGAKVTVKTFTISTLRFILHSEGGNPLVPLSPDIDTYVHMSVTFSATHIQMQGDVKGDDFPNAEVFVYDPFGGSKLIFHYETSGGKNTGPLTSLFGASSDNLLGSFSERIPVNSRGAFRILVDSGPRRTPIETGPARRTPVASGGTGPARRTPIATGVE